VGRMRQPFGELEQQPRLVLHERDPELPRGTRG
jgi:hypothetical protein